MGGGRYSKVRRHGGGRPEARGPKGRSSRAEAEWGFWGGAAKPFPTN